MIDWNCGPSCSSLTRLLTGVLALKNASQLVDDRGGRGGRGQRPGSPLGTRLRQGEVGAVEEGAVGGMADVLGLLLPHAAAVAASASERERPERGARNADENSYSYPPTRVQPTHIPGPAVFESGVRCRAFPPGANQMPAAVSRRLCDAGGVSDL